MVHTLTTSVSRLFVMIKRCRCILASINRSGGIINMYDILTFGASIDELNTEAIQQAIDAAASAGGGTVVVPAGEFLTGALFLKAM